MTFHADDSVAVPARILSSTQLALLAERGEELTAEVGEKLYEIGDATYPFIAILEGEVAVLDGAGHEIVRHGASGFLGEVNLLSGQSVFVTAVVTQPLRYIALQREDLRALLFDDPSLSDLILGALVERRELLQQRQGIGPEIVGPRESPDTRRLLEFARAQRLPYTWIDPTETTDGAGSEAEPSVSATPLVRLPGGAQLLNPSNGELSRALGIGMELAPREEVDLLIIGGGPAGLGAAVYGASEGLDTLIVESSSIGGQAGTSRRIENYLGFPAGISGNELLSRAATQARKFGARLASPYRAQELQPGIDRHLVKLEDGNEIAARAVLLTTGAEYRRLPVAGLEEYEGVSVFYAAGPTEGQLCTAQRVGVLGGGNSAAQAAVWLARGGALVTLMHRRGDLRETMSQYLIDELDRYGVAVRDRCEIVGLQGEDGRLRSVTLAGGEQLPFSFVFLFLGAAPCTEWLGEVLARDDDGFILTGANVGAEGLLETSVPGVYAAGDVRAGSIKRCATAVGEGAAVVQFVHGHLARATAESREMPTSRSGSPTAPDERDPAAIRLPSAPT
ncbi:MAG TPA: FAD-dependent oxidoreductase [Solirubrobacteraceae bacterium]|jgi:thioredoxin reductase (NADPH)|nr:FAD-dependent oxidoreductase [Solirubrobacteraceae bacterium]